MIVKISYLIAINCVDASAWNQVVLILFLCILFVFPTATGETKMLRKCSSLKVLETFRKCNLLVDIRSSRLQSGNYDYYDIVDDFDEIVDLVNSEGGWTVYGWGKRGLINDVSLLGNNIKEPGDNTILSQEISNHVVHIHPQKKDHLDLSTIHGRSLDNLKCNFYTL